MSTNVASTVNAVHGKVTVAGRGVRDLLVTVYDVDPGTQPEEDLGSSNVVPGANTWQGFQGDRLGSALTDQNGTFELTYEDRDFQVRNKEEKRPDLMLVVTAPEEPGVTPCPTILHASWGIRQNAGRTESYAIRLSAEQLQKVGIPIPSPQVQEPEEPETVINRAAEAEERREKIDKGLRQLATKRVEQQRARALAFKWKVEQPLRAALSKTPKELVKPERFVGPDDGVEAKMEEAIVDGINTVVNNADGSHRAPITGYAWLTEE